MTDVSLTILPETEHDAPAIERLHERTFGPGRYARTAYRLREQGAHSLELSFTARVGTLLVGSVRLSPIRIGETKALLLGPLTVEPPFRERGSPSLPEPNPLWKNGSLRGLSLPPSFGQLPLAAESTG